MSNSVISKVSEKQRSLEALVAHRTKLNTTSQSQKPMSVYLKNRILAESKINYILTK